MWRACSQSMRNRVPTSETASAMPPARRRATTASPCPGPSESLQFFADDLAVVERQHVVADGLGRLVALARDHHDVALTGERKGVRDRGTPIGLDDERS